MSEVFFFFFFTVFMWAGKESSFQFSPMKSHFKAFLFLMWKNIYVDVTDSTMEQEGILEWLFEGFHYSQFSLLRSLLKHIALLC